MLSHAELRVLGCLIEKALATPNAYPLTEAGLVAAANQSTNRDPVVAYDVNTVRRALLGLRQQGLAREVHRAGERVAKHRHLVDEALELSEAEIAVLAVLLLRGPQTAAELRARTERLHAVRSIDAVEGALARLREHPGGALVQLQERRPGQKEARWMHLLLDPDADDRDDPAAAAAEAAAAPATPETGPRISLLSLAAELEALRTEVAALRVEVTRLRDSELP
jgi:uncharacterized protein